MKTTSLLLSFLLLALTLSCIHGHMAIYIPSMYGSEPGNPNSNWAVQPLQDYNFTDWVCPPLLSSPIHLLSLHIINCYI